MEKVAAKKVGLVKIGYLPYAMLENYGKLVNAFRFWRNAQTPQDRESARANAVYVAGVLGHYVGDASQPMHMSIHYNGWSENSPNPKNYTKDRGLHSRYEVGYVNAAVDASGVRPRIKPPQRLAAVWDSIKQHLTQSRERSKKRARITLHRRERNMLGVWLFDEHRGNTVAG